MKTSPEIKEIAIALSKCQAQITGAVKDSKNEYFHSSYADLTSCWDAIRKPLTDNGLSLIQTMNTSLVSGQVEIETTLWHISGQWITSAYSATLPKPDPQTLGSVTTYVKRYMLCAIMGLAPKGDDDDCEKVMREYRATAEPQTNSDPKISMEDRKKLHTSRTTLGISEDSLKNFLMNTYKIDNTGNLRVSMLAGVYKFFTEETKKS